MNVHKYNRKQDYSWNKYRALSRNFNIWSKKLLGSTKSKITKDENGEDLPHLEITEALLINCNNVNNDY